jgi:hypothetical protein
MVISLYGIYRQLRAQGAANAVQRIESLQGQYESERMTHARLALALDLKYDQLSSQTMEKARPLLDFYENLGDLLVAGYITVEEVFNNWGRSVQIWSALLKPVVERQREIEGVPEMYDAHRLVEEMREFEAKRGIVPLQLDPLGLPAHDTVLPETPIKIQTDQSAHRLSPSAMAVMDMADTICWL